MSTVRAPPPSRTRARPNADSFVVWGAGEEKESVRTGKAFEPMPLGAGGQGSGAVRMARNVAKLGIVSLEILPADNILIAISNDHAARVMDCGDAAVPDLTTTLTVTDPKSIAKFTSVNLSSFIDTPDN